MVVERNGSYIRLLVTLSINKSGYKQILYLKVYQVRTTNLLYLPDVIRTIN